MLEVPFLIDCRDCFDPCLSILIFQEIILIKYTERFGRYH